MVSQYVSRDFHETITNRTEIKEEIPELMKFHDLMESLKMNKEIKSLPRFVGEHILSVLEKKQD